ncbi:MAG: hypothetical protein JRN33_07800 [Nitrososphaerota archaeon]|nr:hypothetical protein [Nitrososphaerota archaeon]
MSRSAFVATTVILVVLLAATGAYALSTSSSSQSTISSDQSTITSMQAQLSQSEVTQLAYAHFAAIGSESLTATMSQYGSSPTLYWVVSPSSPLNGTYIGTSAVQGTWTKFFKANPTAYYSIYNFTVSVNGNTATVKADVWYVLGGGKVTLKLPYELAYTSSGNSWTLSTEYWGMPGSPGQITSGILPTSGSVTA